MPRHPLGFKRFFSPPRERGPLSQKPPDAQTTKVRAACEFRLREECKKFSARIVAQTRDVNAALRIEFRNPGTLWLDNASWMPDNTIGGWLDYPFPPLSLTLLRWSVTN